MRTNTMVLALGFFFCWAFPFPELSSSQRPPALAKLYITSTPPGESIEINGAPRNERTPVALVVIPNTYSVRVGSCVAQSVTLSSGETKEVACPPRGFQYYRGVYFPRFSKKPDDVPIAVTYQEQRYVLQSVLSEQYWIIGYFWE